MGGRLMLMALQPNTAYSIMQSQGLEGTLHKGL